MVGQGNEPAEWGSLTPGAAEDLRLLTRFMTDRDAAFDRIYGPRLRRSPVTDTIMRTMVSAFSEGRMHSLAFYQAACRRFATPNTVKSKVLELQVSGVLVIVSEPAKRSKYLLPTKKTIDFYNVCLPSLRDEASKILCRS